jgi:hypothetical protein
LAVEVATRVSLDEYGGTKLVFPPTLPDPLRKGRFMRGPDPYGGLQKRLLELGGPPGYFSR